MIETNRTEGFGIFHYRGGCLRILLMDTGAKIVLKKQSIKTDKDRGEKTPDHNGNRKVKDYRKLKDKREFSNRREGFTLIEMVAAIAIISILSGLTYAGYGYFHEEILLQKAHAQIIGTVKRYREKAFYETHNYRISIDCTQKRLVVEDSILGKTLERVELPEKLRYKLSLSESQLGVMTDITFNGNMSRAFTLYIFGRDRAARSRIAFYTFSQLKYLTVNLYKNISVKDVTYENLINYHETSASQNLIGWERQ